MSNLLKYSSALLIILSITLNLKGNAQNNSILDKASKVSVNASSHSGSVKQIINNDTKEITPSNSSKVTKNDNSNNAPASLKSVKPYSKNKFFRIYKKLAMGDANIA